MVGINIVGLLVALAVLYIPHFGLEKLWWVFNTIAACVMVPTILTLYTDSVSEKGVFWGVLVAFVVGIPLFIYANVIDRPTVAFVVGIPLFIYANVIDRPTWIVGSSLFIVLVSTAFSIAIRPTADERVAAAKSEPAQRL